MGNKGESGTEFLVKPKVVLLIKSHFNTISNAPHEIKIHKITATNKGFIPIFLMIFMESPAPIKNKVSVKPAFEMLMIAGLSFCTNGIQVFKQIATMKKPINQGILTFVALFLNNTTEKMDNGIIHNALASFTVVAI